MPEQKRYEEALRKSESRTRSILETALDAIVMMDGEGVIHEWNPAAEQMVGYGREEALGRKLADLMIPPDLLEHHRAGLARHLVEGCGPILNQRIETMAVRAD